MKPAACLLLWNPIGEILAVTRRQDPRQWCLPGGKCEQGEDFRTCAVRETQEETGVCVPPSILFHLWRGPCESVPGGPHDHDVVTFLAHWEAAWGTPVSCEPGIFPRWMTFEAFLKVSAMPSYNRQLRPLFEDFLTRRG